GRGGLRRDLRRHVSGLGRHAGRAGRAPREGTRMNRPTGTNGLPEARTIRTSRAFGTARAKLWSLFENPADLSMWWGPAGFSNTFEEFDFRPGGAWRFVMRGPDGAEYPMRKRFTAIAPFERIVLDHDDPVHGFRMF